MYQNINILGRVGKIETKGSVTKLSLVVNDKYKDKSGEMIERSEWFNCDAFGKTGEVLNQYVGVGDMLFVSAEYRTSKWVTNDGENKSSHSFVIQKFSFLPKAKSDDKQSSYNNPSKGNNSIPQDDESDLPF